MNPSHSRPTDLVAGALYFARGLPLITRPGVRRYVVVPLAINVLSFAALIYLGSSTLQSALDGWLPGWLEWLSWLLLPLFVLAVLVAGFFCFNMVANLVAAPFNGMLAEAVERHLCDRAPASQGGMAEFARELGRALSSEARKFAYVAVRMLPLLLLMLVPGVGALASVLWLAFGAWMLAVAYADYPMGNHGLGFPEQRGALGRRRLLSLGFGAAVMVALAIPLLNFLVIPWAVAGATLMWVERLAPGAATEAD